MDSSQEPRILITRLSAVGDCVLTMPVLCALRDQFPRATIGWLVEPLGAQLLRGHADLDHLLIAPRGWLKSPRAVAELRRELRRYCFDVAVDVQSLTKSSLAGWLSGARRRIGFAPPQGRELAPWLSTCRVSKTRPHVVDGYLELLAPLGIASPRVRFNLPRQADAAEAVRPLLDDSRLAAGFVVLNPGAGWDSKLWPADRYAEVAAHVGRQFGLPSIVVWAGHRERDWAEQIVAAAAGHAVLAPPTSLPQLVEVVRAARLFVGSDTGPMHLAAAAGTPCVAIFGPTLPAVCGPYGPGHIALQAWHQDGNSRQRRGTDNSAMLAVSAQQVCQACDEVLNRPLRGAHRPALARGA
ncbi:MAG: glycosyltransferase family 9 protein [Pirellulaceae bacterium]|nr:glycosyltransferase family 9 protein [Pirellulaceae bacterium]